MFDFRIGLALAVMIAGLGACSSRSERFDGGSFDSYGYSRTYRGPNYYPSPYRLGGAAPVTRSELE
jgi:hypothetical protein